LSVHLANNLRACYAEMTRQPKQPLSSSEITGRGGIGGTWFCPGCGILMEEQTPGAIQCPQCGRSIWEFVDELIEHHPHRREDGRWTLQFRSIGRITAYTDRTRKSGLCPVGPQYSHIRVREHTFRTRCLNNQHHGRERMRKRNLIAVLVVISLRAVAQENAPKPRVSDAPLTSEQVAVYRAVLAVFSEGIRPRSESSEHHRTL
jgi:hypothetical protein